MTYKNSLLIVILLTLVFITNSCSKQDISEEQKPSLSTAIHLPENAQNQYDYAGKLHNDAISKYLKNYIHKGLTVQRIADFSNKFVMDNRNSIQGLAYAQGRMVASDLSSGEIIQKVLDDKDNDFRNIFANADVSDYGKHRLVEFSNLILNAKDKDNSNTQYDDLYNGIVTYEKSVISDEKLSDADKQVILVTTSVSRYSFYKWYSIYSKSVPAGKVVKKWWEWLIVGVCDAAGAVAGAAGGVGGSIAAGVGASAAGADLLDWAEDN